MNSSTSLHFPSYYHQFQIIKNILDKISYPYLILISFIGLITNTTTVILLSKNFITKSLKNKWTLIALALSDLIFNIALLIRAIHDIFKGNFSHLCIFISFLSHLAELLSACYTVSFTIQRYIAVRYPLKTVMDRGSSPFISLLIIFILSSIFCFALSHDTPYIDCNEELKLSWFIADAIMSFFIPFILIVIFNILIINFIRQHSRSPITIQSTLSRARKRFKNRYKKYLNDETCITDNNTMSNILNSFTHVDENENIELTNRKEEQSPMINDLGSQVFQPSTSQSCEPINIEISFNSKPYSSVLSKFSCQHTRSSSHDSFIYHFSEKYSFQLNNNENYSSLSRRTSQSIRVTRMLILVSTCFLILNAPAHLCVIAFKIYASADNRIVINEHEISDYHYQSINNISSLSKKSFQITNETMISSFQHDIIIEDSITVHLAYLVVFITQLIAYASYSINFFLYSFSGITFRKSLRQIVYKFQKR